MAVDLRASMFRALSELRYIATPKRLRVALDGRTVRDTRDALLVWEPRRVLPSLLSRSQIVDRNKIGDRNGLTHWESGQSVN